MIEGKIAWLLSLWILVLTVNVLLMEVRLELDGANTTSFADVAPLADSVEIWFSKGNVMETDGFGAIFTSDFLIDFASLSTFSFLFALSTDDFFIIFDSSFALVE